MVKKKKPIKTIKFVLYFYNPCGIGKREGIVVPTDETGKQVRGHYPFDYLHQIPPILETLLKQRGIKGVQK